MFGCLLYTCNTVLHIPFQEPTFFMQCCTFSLQKESEEKDRMIEKLNREVQALQKELKEAQHNKGKRRKKQPTPPPTSTNQQPSSSASPTPPPAQQPIPPHPTDTSPSHLPARQDSTSDHCEVPGTVEEGVTDKKEDLQQSTLLTQQEHGSRQDESCEPFDDPSLESTKL